MSTRPVCVGFSERSIRNIGAEAIIARMPIGTNVRNTKRHVRYCRNTANSASPTSVPKRAPIMGTENALPRSCAGNAAAKIALALPIISADPSPVSPRHITTSSRLPAMLMRTEPAVDSTSPVKNRRACPYRSPRRAAGITKAPSISRYMTTSQAESSMPVPKYLASVGSDSATGRLESWTSIYADESAIRTARFSGVVSRGANAPRIPIRLRPLSPAARAC